MPHKNSDPENISKQSPVVWNLVNRLSRLIIQHIATFHRIIIILFNYWRAESKTNPNAFCCFTSDSPEFLHVALDSFRKDLITRRNRGMKGLPWVTQLTEKIFSNQIIKCHLFIDNPNIHLSEGQLPQIVGCTSGIWSWSSVFSAKASSKDWKNPFSTPMKACLIAALICSSFILADEEKKIYGLIKVTVFSLLTPDYPLRKDKSSVQ